jgi:hypothetical protein
MLINAILMLCDALLVLCDAVGRDGRGAITPAPVELELRTPFMVLESNGHGVRE